ncbi:hypothetical protein J6590_094230, partial [Homalodisca vitripennis]
KQNRVGQPAPVCPLHGRQVASGSLVSVSAVCVSRRPLQSHRPVWQGPDAVQNVPRLRSRPRTSTPQLRQLRERGECRPQPRANAICPSPPLTGTPCWCTATPQQPPSTREKMGPYSLSTTENISFLYPLPQFYPDYILASGMTHKRDETDTICSQRLYVQGRSRDKMP